MLADQDVVERGERPEDLGVLERARHATAGDLVRRQSQQVDAVEGGAAGGRAIEAGQHVEDGRLPGAVGADQREDLAPRRVEAHAAERGEPAEGDGEILDAEQRHASRT